MTNVYLVQHAEAKPEEIDPDRPLSGVGRQHAESVAALANKLGVTVKQIRHSGKLRAEQTAELMGKALLPAEGVTAASGLGPLDDVAPVAADLDEASASVMLVGHLPFMERLAGYMTAEDAETPVVDFQNGGIVCLEQQETHWQVRWIITPAVAEACGS